MKNLITIIITLLLMVTFPICKAQNDSAFYEHNISKNVIYVEGMGNGFYWEVPILGTSNYERNIFYSQKINCAIRVGFGYNRFSSHNPHSSANKYYYGFCLPLMFNVMSNPHGNHHLDAGLGIVIISDGLVHNSLLGCTGSVKYLFQRNTKGIYLSSGWTPSFYFDHYFKDRPLNIWAIYAKVLNLATIGIAIGYHF